jgi:hypothetical protein
MPSGCDSLRETPQRHESEALRRPSTCACVCALPRPLSRPSARSYTGGFLLSYCLMLISQGYLGRASAVFSSLMMVLNSVTLSAFWLIPGARPRDEERRGEAPLDLAPGGWSRTRFQRRRRRVNSRRSSRSRRADSRTAPEATTCFWAPRGGGVHNTAYLLTASPLPPHAGTNPNATNTPIWSVLSSLFLGVAGVVLWKRCVSAAPSHRRSLNFVSRRLRCSTSPSWLPIAPVTAR